MTTTSQRPDVTIVRSSTDLRPIHSHNVVSSARYLTLEIIPGAILENREVARASASIDFTTEVEQAALAIGQQLGFGTDPRSRDYRISIRRIPAGVYVVSFEEQFLMELIDELALTVSQFKVAEIQVINAAIVLVEYGRHISLMASAGPPHEDCRIPVHYWVDQWFPAQGSRARGHYNIEVTHREGTCQYRVQIAQHAVGTPEPL